MAVQMYKRRDAALLVMSQCLHSVREGALTWSPMSNVDNGKINLMCDLPRAAKPGKLARNYREWRSLLPVYLWESFFLFCYWVGNRPPLYFCDKMHTTIH